MSRVNVSLQTRSRQNRTNQFEERVDVNSECIAIKSKLQATLVSCQQYYVSTSAEDAFLPPSRLPRRLRLAVQRQKQLRLARAPSNTAPAPQPSSQHAPMTNHSALAANFAASSLSFCDTIE